MLDRVRALAANGVADGLSSARARAYRTRSLLPQFFGDEDQQIQICLNLVKNAAEASPMLVTRRWARRRSKGLSTAYRHGVRVRAAKGQALRGSTLEGPA